MTLAAPSRHATRPATWWPYLRVILPAGLCLAFLIAATYAVILPGVRELVMGQKKAMIKELTRTAWSVLDDLHEQERLGLIDHIQAQARAKSRLRASRYGPEGRDYFWIADFQARLVMHPFRPDQEGRPMPETLDSKGRPLLETFSAVAKSKEGAGYVSYSWESKADPQRFVPKVSYVKAFAPWGWIVGTGIYLEDAQAEMDQIAHQVTVLGLIILILVTALSWEMARHSLRADRELRQMTEDLARSEKNLDSILRTVPDVIYRLDPEGRITFISEAIKRYGHRPGELLGQPILDLIHPEDRDKASFGIQERRTGQRRTEALEVRFLAEPPRPAAAGEEDHPGEAVFSISAEGLYAGDEVRSENFLGTQGIARDVTKTKKMERAWRQSDERYRSLVENTSDGYFIAALPSGRFQFLNRRACEMFGYSMEEGLKLSFWDVVAPEEHPVIQERLKERMAGGTPFPAWNTYSMRRKDGATLQVEVASSIIKSGNEPVVQGLLRDVGGKMRLEERLRHAQKMEAVGNLAGGIAHDFNNIIQVIQGYAQLLLRGKTGADPDYEELQEIEWAADRATDLTRQLLAFSRKLESRLKPLDLNAEVTQVKKILARTIPKMIQIDLRLDRNLPAINADAGQIEQILLNLAVNARDAMPEGGRLTIETGNAVLDEEFCGANPELKPGSYVRLTVSDIGQGMDAATMERIFEPFYTTKGLGKGTGLGLPMVYGIARAHGGGVTCQSEPGQGASFQVFFPALEEKAAALAPDRPADLVALGGRETVLVVDDEPSLVKLAEDILTQHGYGVVSARTGEEALAIYQEKIAAVDLVMLDLGLPGLGGEKCLKEILTLNPQAKVVVVSGYSAAGPASTLLAAGAKSFLPKPYRLEELLRTVRSVLEGRE